MNSPSQNYNNHKRLHPLYHGALLLLTLASDVVAVVNAVRAWNAGSGELTAALLVLMAATLSVLLMLVRTYPIKVQDRVIRAEEQLRHYMLTQKPLDPRLTLPQVIALRFASDAEFPALCAKAAAEGLSPQAIKTAVKAWRADTHRV
ncbi:hypothetical protein B5M42_003260 [Paenibacillus athensensis]|uniref:Uncharacterized protein n=1 Tax=Paenibacillus athensensis TaxID=1967502 RepID=A0A4Y8PXP5_9BACL|nr:DUF6526 family protein [Paenibacillus athensensis]MCD1257858.1 hypothetical protein [Paenibacillus athensensis]